MRSCEPVAALCWQRLQQRGISAAAAGRRHTASAPPTVSSTTCVAVVAVAVCLAALVE